VQVWICFYCVSFMCLMLHCFSGEINISTLIRQLSVEDSFRVVIWYVTRCWTTRIVTLCGRGTSDWVTTKNFIMMSAKCCSELSLHSLRGFVSRLAASSCDILLEILSNQNDLGFRIPTFAIKWSPPILISVSSAIILVAA